MPIAVMNKAGRSFGGHTVLKDVDLTISERELVGVVGPNGGGKSTLLLLLAGLLRPTSGSVSIEGVAATELALRAAGHVGLVTARPGLYPLLTGRENLHHFGGLYGLTPSDVDAKAKPIVERLEVERLDERVSALSTGMQQKLSLVRALLLSPKVLLLDEPTANLDPPIAHALVTELRRRVDAGLACVLVTHDLSAAESLCDRALLVDGGIKRELTFKERREPKSGPLLTAWRQALGAA